MEHNIVDGKCTHCGFGAGYIAFNGWGPCPGKDVPSQIHAPSQTYCTPNTVNVAPSTNDTSELLRTPGDVLLWLTFIVLPATVLWLFTFETAAKGWFYFSIIAVLFLCWSQFDEDNSRTQLFGGINRHVLVNTVLAWIPVMVLLIPGIMVAISCDVIISETIRYIELKTLQLHHFTGDQLSQATFDLEHRNYSWWWPPDWIRKGFDNLKLDLLRSTSTHVATSGIILHTFFACIYTVLLCIQIASLAIISAIVFRSFIHVLFRVWLRDGHGAIEFSLASVRTNPVK